MSENKVEVTHMQIRTDTRAKLATKTAKRMTQSAQWSPVSFSQIPLHRRLS